MRLQIENDSQWHELRAKHVGASEVAALFGCGFQSHFQLWHEKRGTLAHEDYKDNERVVLGKCLEDGIAKAASELYGFALVKAKDYWTDDTTEGLGATPDSYWLCGAAEVPAEIKNASWGQWRDNWITHEDGTVEAPLRYLLQVQTQLACTGAREGLLIALISGDRLVKCHIDRHEDAIAEIRRRTLAFWQSVHDGIEPPAELPRDLDAAKNAWTAGNGSVDLSGDIDVERWLEDLAELRSMRKRIEVDEEVIEGRVLQYCVHNSYAAIKANGGRISCKQIDAKPERLITFQAQPSRIALRITPSKP